MQNSNLKDGTNVPTSTTADVTSSSQTIAKPNVGGSFVSYEDILKKKQDYYGKTEASFHFAAEQYATLKMINENKSILEMAKVNMDSRAVIVLESRVKELKRLVS